MGVQWIRRIYIKNRVEKSLLVSLKKSLFLNGLKVITGKIKFGFDQSSISSVNWFLDNLLNFTVS